MSVPADTGPPAGQPTGVIHDIGYRRYEGERLGRGYAVRSLFAYSLRAAFGLGRPARAKVLPFGLAAMLVLPAVGSVALTARFGLAPIPYGRYAYFLQPVIAIFLATQAPVLVTGDLRHNVLPLYFSRPLARGDYVWAKLGALFAAVLSLLIAPLLVLYLGGLLFGLQPAEQTVQLLPALAGSVVLAALLSALGLVLTAFTKRGFFGMAAIIGVYLLTSAAVSIVRQVGLGAGHPEVVRYAGLLSPFDMVAGFQDWVLGTRPGGAPPDVTAGAVYTAVILAVIAGCTGVLLWRYRKVTT